MATEVQWDKPETKTTVGGSKTPAGVNWEELRSRSLRPGGFGAERISIWPRLLNAKIQVSSSLHSITVRQSAGSEVNDGDTKEGLSTEDSLTNNATKPSVEHRDEHQIKLDTDRSFVLYPEESETRVPKDSLKSELNHLTVSIFRNRPKLNYFQGYHDIMTVIYLTLPRELQLTCAEKLSLHRLRDSMLHTLEPVLGLLRVLKNLMRISDPDYAKLLERDSPLPFCALSNLLTLFSHDMPTLPLIQHVFDYLLCRPPIAVVYLAAAFLLSRKEYIQSVKGQLEPFMFHPILSSLPALTEGFEERQINEEAMTLQPPSENFSSKPAVDVSLAEQQFVRNTGKHESSSSSAASASASHFLVHSAAPDNPNIGPRATDANGEIDQKLDDEPSPDLDVYNGQLPSSKVSTPTDSTKQALSKPSPSTSPPLSPSRPSPVEPRLASSSSSSLHLGESSVPPTNPIPLPKILSHSDSLYAQYPPTHPSLRLSLIMGPQSVVFTWSETFSDLPSDTTAEAMTGRPELVVYPVGPEETEDKEDSGEEEDTDTDSDAEYRDEKEKRGRQPKATRKKEGTTTRRKRRKTIRKKIRKVLGALHFGTQVDGRTMVAGAVVVLGVAMAVYGIKATGSSTGGGLGGNGEDPVVHFLARHLPGHTHGYLQEELKKIAGVCVGVGAKFLKLGGEET
ncbi:Rab-GTPase-TBC domain containing protein [Amanita muscaria]